MVSYKDNKKFLRIVNAYAHEYSGEKSKYADNALYNFLIELYVSEQMRNTSVFLISGLGNLLMGVCTLLKPNDMEMEKYFPVLFVVAPDKNNGSYRERYSEIIKNRRILVAPFDVCFTLREIIYENKYKENLFNEQFGNGESLFKYINPKERLCSKYYQINKCFCKENR